MYWLPAGSVRFLFFPKGNPLKISHCKNLKFINCIDLNKNIYGLLACKIGTI